MPGALPTGNDPDHFDLGDWGILGAGFSALANRTQDVVEAFLKGQVQGSPGWGLASSKMFAGLFPDGETPFPVLLLGAIIEQILGFVPGGQTVIDLLTELGNFFGGKWDSLDDIVTNFLNLIQNIINAFERAVPIPGFNGLLDAVFDIFTGIFDRGDTNTKSILVLEAAVFGEGFINEDFQGPDENELTGYTHYNFGPATQGSIGRKSNYAYFRAGITASDQSIVCVNNTYRIGDHIQKTTHLLRTDVNIQGDCAYWIPLRLNKPASTSGMDCCYVRLDGTRIYLGVMNMGAATDLYTINYTGADQERWDFQIGDPGGSNDWLWRVWRNNVDMTNGGVTLTPSNPLRARLLDANHDYCGFAMTADGVFLFVPFQVPPTSVEAISWQVPQI